MFKYLFRFLFPAFFADDFFAAVLSVSIGNISGFGANYHLLQLLVYINVPIMAQPEAYIGGADDNGELTKEDMKEFLHKFLSAFEKWVQVNWDATDQT